MGVASFIARSNMNPKTIDPQSFTGRILRESLQTLAAAAKEKGDPEAEQKVKELGEKCYGGDWGGPYVLEPYKPLGGATSFTDAETYTEGIEYEAKVNDLTWRFRDIITNVLASETIAVAEKATAIAGAAQDFETRLGAFIKREAAETQADEDEEADLVAAVLAAGEREWSGALAEFKAGKRISKTTMATLESARSALVDVINWGSYAANDPEENVEEKIDLSAVNGTNSSVEGGENTADPGVDPNKANKGFLDRLLRRSKDGTAINDLPDSAFAYIEPGGKKVDGKTTPRSLRHFPIHDDPHIRDALARVRGGQSPFAKDALPKVEAAAKKAGIGQPAAEAAKKDFQSGFVAFKGDDGKYRWFSVYSNRYYDRDSEAFSEKSHLEYVAHVDKTKEFPELWTWHQPIVMGRADMVDYDAEDGLAVAAGYFNPGFEDAAEALAQMKEVGVSHGYNYLRGDLSSDGTYSRYRTFEISPLPKDRAANPVTMFVADIQEEGTMLTKEKRSWLVGIAGEERVKSLESGLAVMGKELAGSGIGFKEIQEALAGEKHVLPGDTCPTCGQVMPEAGASKESTAAAGTVPLNAAVDYAALGAVIASAIKEATDPLKAEIAALKSSEDEKIAAMFGPRYDPSKTGPSQDTANVVTGPRGGANDQKAKEMGADLAASVREAMKAQTEAEKGQKGIRTDLPEHLNAYAEWGLFGRQPEPAAV